MDLHTILAAIILVPLSVQMALLPRATSTVVGTSRKRNEDAGRIAPNVRCSGSSSFRNAYARLCSVARVQSSQM
jgi:hypothetical protein